MKKALAPAEKRHLVAYMVSAFALSIRKACASMKLSRSLYRYQTQKQPDDEVITVLLSVVERYPRYGVLILSTL